MKSFRIFLHISFILFLLIILQTCVSIPDKYDTLGRLKTQKTENKFTKKNVFEEVFKYHEDTLKIKEYIKFSLEENDRKIIEKKTFDYDEKQRRIKGTHYALELSKLRVKKAVDVKYDENFPNRIERIILFKGAIIDYILEPVYNKANRIDEVYTIKNNLRKRTAKYSYDKNNNLLKAEKGSLYTEYVYNKFGQIKFYISKKGQFVIQKSILKYDDDNRLTYSINTVWQTIGSILEEWEILYDKGIPFKCKHTYWKYYYPDENKKIISPLKKIDTSSNITSKKELKDNNIQKLKNEKRKYRKIKASLETDIETNSTQIAMDIFLRGNIIYPPAPLYPKIINPLNEISWYPWDENNMQKSKNLK